MATRCRFSLAQRILLIPIHAEILVLPIYKVLRVPSRSTSIRSAFNSTVQWRLTMSVGFTELLLIVLFILIVFGAKRIPELAKALGRASFEYKKARNALAEESRELMETAEKAAISKAQDASEKKES